MFSSLREGLTHMWGIWCAQFATTIDHCASLDSLGFSCVGVNSLYFDRFSAEEFCKNCY
jgi:hypothetical protein